MEALLISTGTVALAEMGDKTQLLAVLLAARFQRPWPVIAGIFVATVANHALAALLGTLVAGWLTDEVLRWAVGLGFLATAVWALIPDKDEGMPKAGAGLGAFAATVVAFFILEMGDKTQIATVALAARFEAPVMVTLGTTLGMLLANVPAVIFAEKLLKVIPLRAMRLAAAAVFAVLGVFTLLR
ncbi:TMEM165/GDT1 family protein [Sandaracinobacteroides saxicola]|uniref:GDT1 family protein n=1 Tax=Sandaracinobacteroides saxicola TaxID=2759707 RepID=A0A7G5IME3_9SPHN|nr:TMEM165/GDT1 family protein [Sandaracinobacteroides saxicola]